MSRVLLVALTLVAAVIRRHAPLDLWSAWDGQWYQGIATHGYHWGINGKPALAFFPLYPLLIRVGIALGISGLAAGMLIANAAFVGASFYLYRWAAEESDERDARRTVWLVTFLPTAFFFFAPYSESLALLCAVGAFYHARRQQVLASGLWTAAAILTRPTGIIVLPAVIAYLMACRGRRGYLSLPGAVLPSLLALAGYLWYLSSQHIDISTLLSAQRAWHRGLTFPWTGFSASSHWLIVHGTSNIPWAIENVLQLAVTVLFLTLTVLAWRDLDRASRIYILGFWAVVLVSPEWQDGYYAPFSSMDRFVLLLFPLFLWIARRIPPGKSSQLLVPSAAFMLVAAAVQLAGGWVG